MKPKKTKNYQKSFNTIQNDVASDMYTNPNSQEIGKFAGPMGGVIVKRLIEIGEETLMKQNKKNK